MALHIQSSNDDQPKARKIPKNTMMELKEVMKEYYGKDTTNLIEDIKSVCVRKKVHLRGATIHKENPILEVKLFLDGSTYYVKVNKGKEE